MMPRGGPRQGQAGFGEYIGAAELRDGPLRVLPLRTFLEALTSGRVLA